MTGRERVLAMEAGRPVDSLPCLAITMQFAAARIGAPYQEYATDYRTLVEGQVRVAEEFDLDYVNSMSDPCVEAADLGAEVVFYPDAVPSMIESNSLLADPAALDRLELPDPLRPGSRMKNRLDAIALSQRRVGGTKLVEGWVEGPTAEAADLRGINTLMTDFHDRPDFVRRLFEFVVEMELRFAQAQVDAGAEQIGIGDAAASLAGPRPWANLIGPFEQRLVDGIHAMGVPARLHICGDTRRILEGMGRLGCELVDLDFLSPMTEGRAAMGPEQTLLGNLDPVRVLQDGTPESVYAAVGECHRQAGRRYIVGAGCEVTRDTPPDNFHALVRYAREHT